MQALSQQLAALPRSKEPEVMEKARDIIVKLREMNNRWNIAELNRFLKEQQREIFFG